jgi:hypothetical protein
VKRELSDMGEMKGRKMAIVWRRVHSHWRNYDSVRKGEGADLNRCKKRGQSTSGGKWCSSRVGLRERPSNTREIGFCHDDILREDLRVRWNF